MINNGYFGAIEKYNDQDFQLAGSEINLDSILSLSKNFWEFKITYCQKYINNYMCTIIAGCGILSNIFGYKFTKEELLELIELAKKENPPFQDGVGWYIYKAVDLVRRYWNKKHPDKQVITYRILLDSYEFWKLLEKGYMIQSGFRGSREFSADKMDNCKIDKVEKVANPTYGHSIYFVKSKGKLFTVDSYDCYRCNEYEVDNFSELVKNKVYFKFGYVFIPKNNLMTQLEKDIQDIELALKLGITKNRRNLENIKKGKYTTDVKMFLGDVRTYKLIINEISSKQNIS